MEFEKSSQRVKELEVELAGSSQRVKELEGSSQRVKDLDAEIEGRSQRVTELETELEGSSQRAKELETELEGSSQRVKDLEAELDELRGEARRGEQELAGVREALVAARTTGSSDEARGEALLDAERAARKEAEEGARAWEGKAGGAQQEVAQPSTLTTKPFTLNTTHSTQTLKPKP